MNNVPTPSAPPVPSIHIEGTEDSSALFDAGEIFSTDMCSIYNFGSEDTSLYPYSRSSQSEYLPSNSFSNSSFELDAIPELSHLATTSPEYLTGHGYSFPYSTILHENGATTSTDGGLSPSSLGSPGFPSPTSSFASSLSPSSFYDIGLSDSESPVSPSPATPDQQFPWPSQVSTNQSSDSLVLHPFMRSSYSTSVLPSGTLGPATHRRTKSSSSSRREPVASKAMLEANSRRRRHPAQFECPDCSQTFTALFSLKRHAQSHTGERPFVCSIPGCTQRFYNSSDCKRHEKSKKRHKDLTQ